VTSVFVIFGDYSLHHGTDFYAKNINRRRYGYIRMTIFNIYTLNPLVPPAPY